MRVVAGGAAQPRTALTASLTLAGVTAILAFAAVTPLNTAQLVAPAALAVAAIASARSLLAWRTLLGSMVLVILVIPIRRYTLPGHLPFELEPYRLLVAVIAAMWASSLLIDPKVRLRRTAFDRPVLAIITCVLLSDALNTKHIADLNVSSTVIKQISFLASFFLVYYMIVSLVRRREQLDGLLKTLVGGAAVVSVAALVEARTGYNVFNHLQGKIPLIHFEHQDLGFGYGLDRGGRSRVFASAQHPIALGAALVVALPIAVYLARQTRRWIWLLAAALLLAAAMATVSRTSVVMLFVVIAIYVRHRPRRVLRMWPALIPLLVVVHLAAPGSLGSLKESFFPKGGLITEQKKAAGTVGSGRIADLGPSLREWSQAPVLGQGYGTRIPDGPKANAKILDDEWLTTLLETGLAGALAWVWLLFAAIRRFGRAARGDPTSRGLLLLSIEASVAAFTVGMLFYDAFSFIQVVFLLFILLALGSVVLTEQRVSDAIAVTPTGGVRLPPALPRLSDSRTSVPRPVRLRAPSRERLIQLIAFIGLVIALIFLAKLLSAAPSSSRSGVGPATALVRQL
jgi:O-antigen ligase